MTHNVLCYITHSHICTIAAGFMWLCLPHLIAYADIDKQIPSEHRHPIADISKITHNEELSSHTKIIWKKYYHNQLPSIEKDLVEKLSRHPYHPQSHYHLALYYALLFERSSQILTEDVMQQMRWVQTSFRLAHQTITLHPQSPLGYIALGYAYSAIQDYDQAYNILVKLRHRLHKIPRESYHLVSRIIAAEEHTDTQLLSEYLSILLLDHKISGTLFYYLLSPIVHLAQYHHLPQHLQQLSVSTTNLQPNIIQKMGIYFAMRSKYWREQQYTDNMLRYAQQAYNYGIQNLDIYLSLSEGYAYSQPQLSKHYLQKAQKFAALPTAKNTVIPVQKSEEQARLHLMNANYQLHHTQHFDQVSFKKALEILAHTKPMLAEFTLKDILKHAPSHSTKQKQILLSFFHHVQKTLPTLHSIHHILSEFEHKHGRVDQAIEHMRNAIALHEDYADFHAKLGEMLYEIKKIPDASHAFQQALTLDPENSKHHYNVACMNALLGQHSQAIMHLKNAIDINPELSKKAANDSHFISIIHLTQFHQLLKTPNL